MPLNACITHKEGVIYVLRDQLLALSDSTPPHPPCSFYEINHYLILSMSHFAVLIPSSLNGNDEHNHLPDPLPLP